MLWNERFALLPRFLDWYVATNGGAVWAVADVDVVRTRVQSYSKPTSDLGTWKSLESRIVI